MKLAATLELHAYWNRLRGARSAPERGDLDPGAIRGVLADTFVLDFDDQRGFPFRIASSRANALFLKEQRGLSFLELWRDADREELDSILHCVADETQPFLIGAQARPAGLEAVDIEIILLPLRHHGLTHSRILGGTRRPRRARLDGPYEGGAHRADLAASARIIDAGEAGAEGRGAGGLLAPRHPEAPQASVCLF